MRFSDQRSAEEDLEYEEREYYAQIEREYYDHLRSEIEREYYEDCEREYAKHLAQLAALGDSVSKP